MTSKTPKPSLLPGREYRRTAEDELNDRLEREWKQKRNEEALRSLQRHSSFHRKIPR